MATLPTFRRHTIFVGEPSERTTCVVGDLNGDGVPEVVDGDGRLELVAGLSWYRPLPNGDWERHIFAQGAHEQSHPCGHCCAQGAHEQSHPCGTAAPRGRTSNPIHAALLRPRVTCRPSRWPPISTATAGPRS